MTQRIILDCDPGVDDAIAIMLALASPDDLALEAITTVAGNVALSSTSMNAVRVCDIIGRDDIPVFAGADRPIARTGVSDNVHGSDGLGDIGLPKPSRDTARESAVDAIIRIVSSNPGEIVICVTGPMTNLALGLEREPALASMVRKVVFMGGAVRHPGNVTARAEFNIWFDPDAADIVFRSGIPLVMFALDVTSTAVLTPDRIGNLVVQGRAGSISAKMLTAYATGDVCLHDPCVIAYLIEPGLFNGEPIHLKAHRNAGPDYGMTVSDDDAPVNCLFITGLDADGLFGLLAERTARLN